MSVILPKKYPSPFSFDEREILKKWSENISDKAGAQSVFDHRAYMNSLASTGAWDASKEKTS